MKLSWGILLVVLAAGCGPSPAPQTKPAADSPKEKSAAATMVDGLTGRTAVNAGRKAQDDIKRISSEKNKDLEAVMDK